MSLASSPSPSRRTTVPFPYLGCMTFEPARRPEAFLSCWAAGRNVAADEARRGGAGGIMSRWGGTVDLGGTVDFGETTGFAAAAGLVSQGGVSSKSEPVDGFGGGGGAGGGPTGGRGGGCTIGRMTGLAVAAEFPPPKNWLMLSAAELGREE